jgi:hypothetical protein
VYNRLLSPFISKKNRKIHVYKFFTERIVKTQTPLEKKLYLGLGGIKAAMQCSGSGGSVCSCVSRIRSLPSTSKKNNEKIDLDCFVIF